MINFHWFLAPSFWDLAAIIISFISLTYTFICNKYHVDITEFEVAQNRNHLLLNFDLTNDSPKTLKVLKISMFKNGKEISAIDFDPQEFDKRQRKIKSDKWIAENTNPNFGVPLSFNPYQNPLFVNYNFINKFKFPTSMLPYSQRTYSFYISDKPDKITVYTDKHVGIFKHRSFKVG